MLAQDWRGQILERLGRRGQARHQLKPLHEQHAAARAPDRCRNDLRLPVALESEHGLGLDAQGIFEALSSYWARRANRPRALDFREVAAVPDISLLVPSASGVEPPPLPQGWTRWPLADMRPSIVIG